MIARAMILAAAAALLGPPAAWGQPAYAGDAELAELREKALLLALGCEAELDGRRPIGGVCGEWTDVTGVYLLRLADKGEWCARLQAEKAGALAAGRPSAPLPIGCPVRLQGEQVIDRFNQIGPRLGLAEIRPPAPAPAP